MADPKANPANAPAKRVTEATRIPMSVPQLRLEVPEVPGYHLHWFLGQNVPRAMKAGYEFVEEDEVEVNNLGVANSKTDSGSTDMGTRISQLAGGLQAHSAEPQRLYLMKLRREWRDKDVQALEAVNEKIAVQLRGGDAPALGGAGGPSEDPRDRASRYLKKGQDIFYPKTRKV